VKFVKILKRVVINSDQSNESLAAIVAGTANQSELLNNKLGALIRSSDQSNQSLAAIVAGTANQSELLNNKLGALIRSSDEQSRLFNAKLQEIIEQLNTLVELHRAEMELMRLILVGIASADIDSMDISPIPTQHTPSFTDSTSGTDRVG
jgi:hypothetical protein